ncbi:MAG: ChbG/HpnK family deacetylase [Terracidiphilus sp.]|nr:ChbG/HpnK family deacetylase [Terracidiphilus sp.]MDR3796586.1 ChbG/HpnK family deacetylase [Terracidiphilus sp.]
MRRLIVNTDDFGLTSGVNRAIIELHAAGLVTSASLMARAGATDEAVELACATPSLGVGCHVVLVDGEPVLPPEKISSLVDARTGRFLNSLTAFLLRLFTGRIPAEEIEAEAAAQIAYLQQRGVQLTHIDTHKHAHIFSAVLRPVLRAARAAGIRAVRHPFEPEWAVRAAIGAPLARVVQIAALRPLAPRSRHAIEQGGFTTTDGTIAVAGTGTLNEATLRSLLEQLPAGTWELVTHPGYSDADLARVRTRLRASRDVERLALTAIQEVPGIELISFAQLETSAPATPADMLTR